VSLIYIRQKQGKLQLLVPRTLIREVIKENHEPAYAAHPGVRRTCELISLSFWWSGMRKSVEEFVRECDSCQRRKGEHEFTAPLGCVGNSTAPFEITSMDITGPYAVTPRKNRYLLTFVDNFSKYAEIYPIPEQSAMTCAKVYTSQIITRHGSGSKLITDQGAAFISLFFIETCRIMGIYTSRTLSHHPMSNGHVERMHRTLHTALSHYVNQSHIEWDIRVSFFLMAYHSTPHSTTGSSPFFLLHDRKMVTPANENLKAKVPKPTQALEQQLEDLKSRLKQHLGRSP
jgi:transposase InsO family protein